MNNLCFKNKPVANPYSFWYPFWDEYEFGYVQFSQNELAIEVFVISPNVAVAPQNSPILYKNKRIRIQINKDELI